ncbi:protein of unknown function [Streptomyces murinus]
MFARGDRPAQDRSCRRRGTALATDFSTTRTPAVQKLPEASGASQLKTPQPNTRATGPAFHNDNCFARTSCAPRALPVRGACG